MAAGLASGSGETDAGGGCPPLAGAVERSRELGRRGHRCGAKVEMSAGPGHEGVPPNAPAPSLDRAGQLDELGVVSGGPSRRGDSGQRTCRRPCALQRRGVATVRMSSPGMDSGGPDRVCVGAGDRGSRHAVGVWPLCGRPTGATDGFFDHGPVLEDHGQGEVAKDEEEWPRYREASLSSFLPNERTRLGSGGGGTSKRRGLLSASPWRYGRDCARIARDKTSSRCEGSGGETPRLEGRAAFSRVRRRYASGSRARARGGCPVGPNQPAAGSALGDVTRWGKCARRERDAFGGRQTVGFVR